MRSSSLILTGETVDCLELSRSSDRVFAQLSAQEENVGCILSDCGTSDAPSFRRRRTRPDRSLSCLRVTSVNVVSIVTSLD
jgi:hypothetical protein